MIKIGEGKITKNGKNNNLHRNWTPSPTQTAPTKFQVGASDTSPTEADTTLVKVLPLNNENLIDACDAVAGWANSADALAEILNNVTFKEGTGSLDLGKNGVASVDFFYTKTVAADDFTTDKYLALWFWVTDAAAIAKFDTKVNGGVSLYLSSDNFAVNYTGWYTEGSNTLSTGWNYMVVDTSVTGDDVAGTLNLAAVTEIRLHMRTNLAADTLASGDCIMDFWRNFSYADTIGSFSTGPTFNTSDKTVTLTYSVAFTELVGYVLTETGVANTDSPPLLTSRDTYTSITKTNKVKAIFTYKDENT